MKRADVTYLAPVGARNGFKAERGFYLTSPGRDDVLAGPFKSERDAIEYARRKGFIL